MPCFAALMRGAQTFGPQDDTTLVGTKKNGRLPPPVVTIRNV
jgi:hypothetical protein